ncbi:GHMP kinase [Candidatus Thorarchaeota archaeon]|nr:MAG: GHMP kinase [Candidatus Thorarchaeota archaeon]
MTIDRRVSEPFMYIHFILIYPRKQNPIHIFMNGPVQDELTETLKPSVGTATAFVPGHITGFFKIHDASSNLLERGSTGAGFCITAGTVTTIELVEQDEHDVLVTYNGERIKAEITEMVVERVSELYGKRFSAKVEHDSELPIGVGYGASGAGALGTALAMNYILDSEMTPQVAAQYAHYAEVAKQGGLGDVIAQFTGGMEIRTRPGAPGIGEIDPFRCESPVSVVLAGSTGLETKSVLSNEGYRRRINERGSQLVGGMRDRPTCEQFIKASRDFAHFTGLMSDRIDAALSELDNANLKNSSMVMLGDSLFCLCSQSDVDRARNILTDYWMPEEMLVTTIANRGGGILH